MVVFQIKKGSANQKAPGGVTRADAIVQSYGPAAAPSSLLSVHRWTPLPRDAPSCRDDDH
jgi:hypothetical protein